MFCDNHWHILPVKYIVKTSQPEICKFSDECYCFWLRYQQFYVLDTLTALVGCTLRSGLHEIPTMIRIFPHGLQNNHACKWTSDSFIGIHMYVLFLENFQKTICMHGYSPILVDRSLTLSWPGFRTGLNKSLMIFYWQGKSALPWPSM